MTVESLLSRMSMDLTAQVCVCVRVGVGIYFIHMWCNCMNLAVNPGRMINYRIPTVTRCAFKTCFNLLTNSWGQN